MQTRRERVNAVQYINLAKESFVVPALAWCGKAAKRAGRAERGFDQTFAPIAE